MKSVYVLVVDKTWAKLYKTGPPPVQLTLVYHQALFGGRPDGKAADEELARNLCRLLRADRQMGKYAQLIMIASADMLAALRRQYDGELAYVIAGKLEDLPPRYASEDLNDCVQRLLTRAPQANDLLPPDEAKEVDRSRLLESTTRVG